MTLSPRIAAIASLGLGLATLGLSAALAGTGAGAASDEAASAESPVVQMASGTGSMSETLPPVPAEAPAAPILAQPGRLTQAPADVGSVSEQPDLSPFGLPCGLSVTATAGDGAMVALDIMDPCQPFERVVIEHSGLNLTGQTGVMGLLTMDIPAFENPAFFTVRMPDGTSESALAVVADLDQYNRAGVQWNEDRQLELHAMEFGATYGEPGDIWAGNPGNIDRALSGEGGFLTEVGDASVDEPMLAQIYTFPRDTMLDRGNVRLTIEAPVTAANCGLPTEARTLELAEDGTVSVVGLDFTVPGCDAVGDYLLLQNLLQDLRIASN